MEINTAITVRLLFVTGKIWEMYLNLVIRILKKYIPGVKILKMQF